MNSIIDKDRKLEPGDLSISADEGSEEEPEVIRKPKTSSKRREASERVFIEDAKLGIRIELESGVTPIQSLLLYSANFFEGLLELRNRESNKNGDRQYLG